MCGIAGGFWPNPASNVEPRLSAALSELEHRGPDDCGLELINTAHGTLAIGQRRLSIIDLSSGGHQPMTTADGALTLVFNGEVYNIRELRDELKACGRGFASRSVSDVLLAAWAEWGAGFLEKIEGMFAFAVYD